MDAHLVGRVSSVAHEDEFEGTTDIYLVPLDYKKRSRKAGLAVRARGYFTHPAVEGERLRVQGEWDRGHDGSPLFQIQSMSRQPPGDRNGEINLLWKVFKIKKSIASDLLEKTGGLGELRQICEKHPKQLETLLPERPRARTALMTADWDRTELDLDIWRALLEVGRGTEGSRGISPNQIKEMIRRFGPRTLKTVLARNPYEVTTVKGVGFDTADKIAFYYATQHDRTFDPLDANRLEQGVAHVLAGHAQSAGDLCVTDEELVAITQRRLRSPSGDRLPRGEKSNTAIRKAIERAVKNRTLVRDYNHLYTRGLYRAESDVALFLSKLTRIGDAKGIRKRRVQKILKKISQEDGIVLSDEQSQAILTMLRSPVSLLTGGPGVGKTLTVGRLIRVLKELDQDFLILAPTGKAANRASSQADAPAYTIHRACMLEIDADVHAKDYGQKLKGVDYFRVSHVIVDESSMPDVRSMWEVLRRVKPGLTRITFVGDEKQLPPVGPGQCFKDFLDSGVIETAQLTKARRTKGNTEALDYFYSVRNGKVPEHEGKTEIIRHVQPEDSAGWAEHHHRDREAAMEAALFQRWIPATIDRYKDDFGVDPIKDVQVYAPQRNGPVGIHQLNEILRDHLNPLPPRLNTKRGHVIRINGSYIVQVGDKVMQQENNYYLRYVESAPDEAYEEHREVLRRLQIRRRKKNPRKHRGQKTVSESDKDVVPVSNGQIGTVLEVDPKNKRLVVDYEEHPFPVLYTESKEWRQVAPAWAMSIHKSQGSEAPVPFVVLPVDAYNLTNPLYYTAITRMKERLVVFAQQSTRNAAIQNYSGVDRKSHIKERLLELIGRKR